MRILTTCVVLLALVCGASGARAQTAVGEVSREELMSRPPERFLILDVRTPEEFAAGHIAHAVNIPHDQLAARLAEIRSHAGDDVLLYCRSGRRAGLAAETLSKAGFTKLHHLTGDMQGWEAAGLPVEKSGS